MTPVCYIRYRRMLVARDLILESEHSLTDISQYLGYSQQSTFCKVFKQYYSVTPKQFRQNNTLRSDIP